MFTALTHALLNAGNDAGQSIWSAGAALVAPAIIFALLALAFRGVSALRTARNAAGEIRINMMLFVFDVLVVSPLLGVAAGLMGAAMQRAGLSLFHPDFWAHAPQWLVGFLAIFAGDFIGYWRHRLEHTPPLWPAHAIHHSDTAMTWTTLFRFHPINRFSTVLIDGAVLALFGFPPWALILNSLVRHYYGMFIHMDLPWTYGLLGRVFVSPAMHRWHHVRDADGAGANFATAFSVFDQGFGTYYVPGPCTAPLGVREDVGQGALPQLLYPFKVAARVIARPFARRTERKLA
jgi:sterol desaturase/sphingolipid hydroxylase (fatty acid hydroxylase superfamily)